MLEFEADRLRLQWCFPLLAPKKSLALVLCDDTGECAHLGSTGGSRSRGRGGCGGEEREEREREREREGEGERGRDGGRGGGKERGGINRGHNGGKLEPTGEFAKWGPRMEWKRRRVTV